MINPTFDRLSMRAGLYRQIREVNHHTQEGGKAKLNTFPKFARGSVSIVPQCEFSEERN